MTNWHDSAACLDTPTEVFYRHEEAKNATLRDRAARQAFAICGACPVAGPCLNDELTRGGAQHGIRGNTWAATRTAMILDRKRAGAA